RLVGAEGQELGDVQGELFVPSAPASALPELDDGIEGNAGTGFGEQPLVQARVPDQARDIDTAARRDAQNSTRREIRHRGSRHHNLRAARASGAQGRPRCVSWSRRKDEDVKKCFMPRQKIAREYREPSISCQREGDRRIDKFLPSSLGFACSATLPRLHSCGLAGRHLWTATKG